MERTSECLALRATSGDASVQLRREGQDRSKGEVEPGSVLEEGGFSGIQSQKKVDSQVYTPLHLALYSN